MAKTDFNSASTLAEAPGTARQAYFGAIDAGNAVLLADILMQHPDAVTWREYRGDLHVADDFGLHVAARNGHLEITKMLINAGADVNARDCEGVAPLMLAILAAREDVVRYLIVEAKANPNHSDGADETPLMVAAAEGMTMAVELLLEAGAKANTFRRRGNALHDAAGSTRPNERLFTLLLRGGIRHDLKDNDDKTPADIARERGADRLAMLANCIAEHLAFTTQQKEEALARDIEGVHGGLGQQLSIHRPCA